MTILTLLAVTWAAVGSWMVLATGLGPLPLWEPSLYPSISIPHPGGGVSVHRLHLSVLDWMLGAYLPLVLLGAFWLWRRARSSNG